MGACCGRSAAVEEIEMKEAAKKEKDGRKRNSLAFNITQFVQFDGDNYTPLLDKIKQENKQKKFRVRAADEKFLVISERVAQGSMKQLRECVILEFKQINRRYRVKFNNSTLLHIICQEGYLDMLEFILDDKNHSELDETKLEIAPRNDRNRTPLHMCFTPPTLTYLGQKYGIDPDTGLPKCERPDGIEVQQDWIKPGGPRVRERCIKVLIDHGCDVNDADFHGFYPLHYAAIYGWIGACDTILKAGADVNAANVSGKTPLMYAVEYQYQRLIEMFLAHVKININTADGEGTTTLMIAVEKVLEVNPPPPPPTEEELADPAYVPPEVEHFDDSSEVALVETLLKAGADPNAMNFRKRTALKMVCERSHKPLLHMLMNFNVIPDPAVLATLNEEAQKEVSDRLNADERKAAAEAARLEKEQRELLEDGLDAVGITGGYVRNKNPYGQWTEYNDKRAKPGSGAVFYYNRVTRIVQREKPRDFKPDKTRITTEATFGMHFYH